MKNRLILLLVSLWTSYGLAQTQPVLRVPLPQLGEGVIELRVAHIINPRLPRMSAAQTALMLEQMKQTAQEHWGLRISFKTPVEIPIAEQFNKIPDKFKARAESLTYNPNNFFQRSSRLQDAFAKGLARTGESLEAQATYANQHAPNIQAKDFDQLGKALANLQLANIAHWQEHKALDGNSVIDDSGFHQFMRWNYLGYGDLPYEFIITNQIIASVEWVLPSVHSAIRGGYTNGITSYSRQSKFGSYSAWSTFAFTNNDALWQKNARGRAVFI
ncbi:MAG: hypothetical protein HC765_04405 [Brachymonas sp.]|nr:hypothetical protein [Brachymonas sp.]